MYMDDRIAIAQRNLDYRHGEEMLERIVRKVLLEEGTIPADFNVFVLLVWSEFLRELGLTFDFHSPFAFINAMNTESLPTANQILCTKAYLTFADHHEFAHLPPPPVLRGRLAGPRGTSPLLGEAPPPPPRYPPPVIPCADRARHSVLSSASRPRADIGRVAGKRLRDLQAAKLRVDRMCAARRGTRKADLPDWAYADWKVYRAKVVAIETGAPAVGSSRADGPLQGAAG